MEVFKFAFETIIIGLLTLPWLCMAIHLMSPDLLRWESERSLLRTVRLIPGEVRPAVIGIVAFSITYILGSAISPVASQFLDGDFAGRVLPTEESIQASVYERLNAAKAARTLASFTTVTFRSNGGIAPEPTPTDPHERFLLEESTVLLKSPKDFGRLTRLHERLSVLRGAAFNSFMLVLISIFSWCGAPRNLRFTRWLAFAPPSMVVVLAAAVSTAEIYHAQIDRVPICEGVLMFLGIFGIVVVARRCACSPRVHGGALACAVFFAVLSYGGYLCTEVSYDEGVIISYRALTVATNAAAPSAAAEE